MSQTYIAYNRKLDLKKWDVRLWAEFIWLMLRSGGRRGCCEDVHEVSVPINGVKLLGYLINSHFTKKDTGP